MGILDGKTAVITGGTRGFGLAMARAFLDQGARVIVASRSGKSVDEALTALAAGSNAAGMSVDVADLTQVKALAERAEQVFGSFDIWINNAGLAGPYGPVQGISTETFHAIIQTNITGVYNGSYTALAYFGQRKQGKLINVLGRGHDSPAPYQAAYGSSKAWVSAFTRALAAETRESGVGVYAFNPGMMLTDLLLEADVVSGYEERLKVFPTIVRMWARPPEVAAAKAAWVASSATDGKTGSVYNMHSTVFQLSGAMKEGIRRLRRQPAANPVHIKSVPYGKG